MNAYQALISNIHKQTCVLIQYKKPEHTGLRQHPTSAWGCCKGQPKVHKADTANCRAGKLDLKPYMPFGQYDIYRLKILPHWHKLWLKLGDLHQQCSGNLMITQSYIQYLQQNELINLKLYLHLP